jgi:hypothetical protein
LLNNFSNNTFYLFISVAAGTSLPYLPAIEYPALIKSKIPALNRVKLFPENSCATATNVKPSAFEALNLTT